MLRFHCIPTRTHPWTFFLSRFQIIRSIIALPVIYLRTMEGCRCNDVDQTKRNHDFYESTARNFTSGSLRVCLSWRSSTSRFIISTSNAMLEWVAGSLWFPLKRRETVACSTARLSDDQRCVVNRCRDDTEKIRCQYLQLADWDVSRKAGNGCSAGRDCPLVATALTARIINEFFIRNRRSLNLPRDLNRSRTGNGRRKTVSR